MLTEESSKILKYIKSKEIKKIPQKTCESYRKLFDFFEEKSSFYIKNKKIVLSINNVKVPKFYSPFISDLILDKIRDLTNHRKIFFQTYISTITINIYYKTGDDISLFENIIIDVIAFIFNISKHSTRNCTINYYLTNIKKQLSSTKNYNEEYIDSHEVNSGSTYLKNNTINIWRKEEIIKVTLHECFHVLNYDLLLREPNEDLITYYKKKYSITSDVLVCEAYTEIWAELMNIFLTVKFQKHKNEYKCFCEYITYEIYFSNYQASKIFYLQNLNERKDFDIDKYTNVLPYFIIKCELFNNLQKFLNYFEEKKEYITLNKDIIELFKKTDKCNKNKEIIRLFKKNDKNNKLFTDDNISFYTARMTCIELFLF